MLCIFAFWLRNCTSRPAASRAEGDGVSVGEKGEMVEAELKEAGAVRLIRVSSSSPAREITMTGRGRRR